MRIKEDTRSFGVGPISLDVEMARKLGWTREQIDQAAAAVAFLARGVSLTRDQESGDACESCFGRTPDKRYVPCTMCGREGLL